MRFVIPALLIGCTAAAPQALENGSPTQDQAAPTVTAPPTQGAPTEAPPSDTPPTFGVPEGEVGELLLDITIEGAGPEDSLAVIALDTLEWSPDALDNGMFEDISHVDGRFHVLLEQHRAAWDSDHWCGDIQCYLYAPALYTDGGRDSDGWHSLWQAEIRWWSRDFLYAWVPPGTATGDYVDGWNQVRVTPDGMYFDFEVLPWQDALHITPDPPGEFEPMTFEVVWDGPPPDAPVGVVGYYPETDPSFDLLTLKPDVPLDVDLLMEDGVATFTPPVPELGVGRWDPDATRLQLHLYVDTDGDGSYTFGEEFHSALDDRLLCGDAFHGDVFFVRPPRSFREYDYLVDFDAHAGFRLADVDFSYGLSDDIAGTTLTATTSCGG